MEKEIEKYKWKYYYRDISETEIEVKVIPEEKYDIPECLYKLFSLSERSVNSLINHTLYAAHPFQFNDIFDCNENLVDFDDDNVIKSFLSAILPISEIEEQIEKDRQGTERFVKDHFSGVLYRKWGIISLTSDPNNILMWSYYNNHQGFCVEYDYSKFPFKHYGPFPINYQEKIDPISVKEAGMLLSVIYQTNIKSKSWEHESEWRIIVDAERDVMKSPKYRRVQALGGRERLFNYPIEAINNIALGNRFFEPDEIKEIDGKTLELNLDSDNAELKETLLDFICSNNTESYIALGNDDLVSIGFRRGKFEKKSKYKYIFNAG